MILEHRKDFWEAGNVPFIDLGGPYVVVFTLCNSLSGILMIYALFSMYFTASYYMKSIKKRKRIGDTKYWKLQRNLD